jgi:hypothetical protein
MRIKSHRELPDYASLAFCILDEKKEKAKECQLRAKFHQEQYEKACKEVEAARERAQRAWNELKTAASQESGQFI